MNELMKSYIIPIEAYSYYILYTLSTIGEHSYNITIYQHFICIFFILLMIFLILIIYYDTIYREANNIKRCRDIELTTTINDSIDYPYVYNIYVIHKKEIKNVLKNYIFYIQYDFVNNNTLVNFGSNIDTDVLIPHRDNDIDNQLNEKAFYYYDLDVDFGHPIEHEYKGKMYYVNKDIISKDDYTFVVSRYDNKDILKDPSAYELLNFIKKYGFDSDFTNLAPIYNIKYAVDNKKNKLSI